MKNLSGNNSFKSKIMKRIYSFAFAAVALFAAASCQDELANEILQNEGGNYTFSATIGADTKTVLAEGNKVNWSVGDNIMVFDATGAAVTFTGQNTEVSATADFHADSYNRGEIETAYAAYPVRSGTNLNGTTIKDLRVAGSQTAIAGSYDPASAVIVGEEVEPGKLAFKNVHSLVKFTIGGDTAPNKVVFTNDGDRNIAGRFDYNTADGTVTPWNDGKTITLTPKAGESFEVGKTYYIVVIGGGNFAKMSLKFDDTEVKYVDGPKYADATNDNLLGKILNFGTVQFPSDEPEPDVETPFNLERVAAYYSNGTNAWCSFIPGISNRTMAADNEYVYLQSSEGEAKIYGIEISSLLAGDATPVYKNIPVDGVSGGTHAVSALRCIPNENGDPILIATNLATDSSQDFNIYAYSNGTDAAPVLFHAYRSDSVANSTDWRRYGDRISVSGTWQNGAIWAPSQSGTKVMGFGIQNGATNAGLSKYCWFDTFGGGLAEVTLYPDSEEAILTTASSAGYWTPNANGEKHSVGYWPKWDAVSTEASLNGAFSFQFFSFEGKDYIAYVQLPDNTHANLVVVEDKGSLQESLTSTKLFELPLYEGAAASCSAGNTYGDCAVVTVNDKFHIVAMMQGGGLSIFEIQSK